MRLFGLIGYPLGHSFSKKFFTEKFERDGFTNCRFELFPIEDISLLPAMLQANLQLEGFAITIPYKQQIIPYLHDTSHLPTGLPACNCVRIINGRLIGYNTDVLGFEQSFASLLQPHHQRALVLGTGGASLAVCAGLRSLGIPYRVVSRTPGDSRLTYTHLNAEVIQQYHIIINCTPVGTYPAVNECPPLPYEWLTQQHYLYDLVYNPPQTLFLKKGAEKGAATQNGHNMLVIQAEHNWRIWNS
jgi:shikimate dehydrogenase